MALPFHDHGTRKEWGVSVTPRPLFTPRKTRYPLYKRLGGPQGLSGQVRKILSPPGFDFRTVQSVASRYTDWAIGPTSCITCCISGSDSTKCCHSMRHHAAPERLTEFSGKPGASIFSIAERDTRPLWSNDPHLSEGKNFISLTKLSFKIPLTTSFNLHKLFTDFCTGIQPFKSREQLLQ